MKEQAYRASPRTYHGPMPYASRMLAPVRLACPSSHYDIFFELEEKTYVSMFLESSLVDCLTERDC